MQKRKEYHEIDPIHKFTKSIIYISDKASVPGHLQYFNLMEIIKRKQNKFLDLF